MTEITLLSSDTFVERDLLTDEELDFTVRRLVERVTLIEGYLTKGGELKAEDRFFPNL
ncbi:MAG: hypothetical protein ACREVA_03525 [Burkholderiales bacterium]